MHLIRYLPIVFLLSLQWSYAKPLTIVCHEFAPFSYHDHRNKPAGILVEMTQLACQSWAQGCKITLLPNRRAKQAFEQGHVNGHFLGWNQARSKQIWFSIPLLQTEYGFYFKRSVPLTHINDAAGKTIGVLAPSNTYSSLITINKELVEAGLSPMKIIKFAAADEQPMRMLNKHRFDAYYVNKNVGAFYANKIGVDSVNYLSSGQQIFYYIGFQMAHNDYQTIKAFNHHLAQLYKAGEFNQILRAYGMHAAKLEPKHFLTLNIPF